MLEIEYMCTTHGKNSYCMVKSYFPLAFEKNKMDHVAELFKHI